jgi:hypothetical protein
MRLIAAEVAQDLEVARRAMACHRTRYPEETLQRVFPAQDRGWNGVIALVPAFRGAKGTDLFPLTHSGPEAWYVLTGAQCLKRPTG